jgi:hypothetical protein
MSARSSCRPVIFIPSLPFRVVGVAMEWATEKIGPLAWVILGVGVVGGIVWYCKQPPDAAQLGG